ncbi:MAG TPA: DUF1302 domain-containing protein [Usitatibacter sp.]|nr:DUF1302 domain-containing protein [Usitatibacter sp.]
MELRKIAVAVGSLGIATAAHAVSYDLDDGAQVIWNTTISAGTSVRAESQDPRLLHPNNAVLQGIGGATGGNTDDGDLNFDKGKAFSSPIKIVTDLEYKKGDFGALVRAKGWYDYTLERKGVPHGSYNNQYTPGDRLSDSNFEQLAKFKGVALLDAYVYDSFNVLGEYDTRVRLGRHVLNWGESVFIQGLNQINPIDVPALRRPGTEVREVLLPVNMVSANMGLGHGMSLEGFYQLEWQNSVADGCGTYFLAVDASVGPNAQNACRAGFLQSLSAAQATTLTGLLHRTIPVGDAGGQAAGAFLPASATREAGGSGQFGLSMKFQAPKLDTEFGLYGMEYNARTPNLSTVKGNSPFPLTTALLGAAAKQESIFWEYPEHIRLWGATASSTIAGVAVGAELSYSPNFPVQLAAGDLLGGLVYGSAPAALGVLGVTAPVAAAMNANRGPLNSRFQAAANGDVVAGYDRLGKAQFQVNAIQIFSNVLGAQSLSVVGELGMQHVNVPDSSTGVRYGRSFVFGIATHPGFGPVAAAVPGGCPILNTANQPGCENAGFVSDFSWGYRLRGQLAYANAFNLGFTVKPSVFWAQDVKGVSADGQFNEGRGTLGLGLGFEYHKAYSLDLSYVTYSNSAKWDPLRDRDYYSISVSASF